METLIGLIIWGAIILLPRLIINLKFNNRIPPAGYKTDWSAMNRDLAMGKSKIEVMSKANRGGYDIRK